MEDRGEIGLALSVRPLPFIPNRPSVLSALNSGFQCTSAGV
jgi:hypothetical protein